MNLRNSYIILALLLVSFGAIGQTIQGRGVDAHINGPLTGATIEVASESTGAIADAQGQFSITPDAYSATLGHGAVLKKIAQKTTLNVRMTSGTQQLNDEYSQMHGLNSGFGGFFDPAMDHNYYAGIKLNYLFN
ncbi:hypothetical protein FNH22_11700 [Fulvivirga sp. M361]|uniref:hypothetical protein n=1 Tax=Fulvivirga sp. M361 TaxID=2594266 RepID=UPI00117A86BA|nr:hypothetical protein [Fulvivirga sp. M361]TRX59181.1 hypothetical protein FNH22_11700 [Fulvivirga sp. M361]